MKICPDCGEEVQDLDVIFHRCSASRVNSETSIVPFLIAGIVGSSIPSCLTYFLALVATGFGGYYPLIQLIIGAAVGLAGYRLFNLNKSPSKRWVAMIVLVAILGFGLPFLLWFVPF